MRRFCNQKAWKLVSPRIYVVDAYWNCLSEAENPQCMFTGKKEKNVYLDNRFIRSYASGVWWKHKGLRSKVVPGLKHGSRHGNVLELTFTTLLAISGDDKLVIFSYFSQKTGFDISCESSPKETICMKCQNLFSGKKKKKFSMSSAENFTQSARR